jgi:hypothetical protein
MKQLEAKVVIDSVITESRKSREGHLFPVEGSDSSGLLKGCKG